MQIAIDFRETIPIKNGLLCNSFFLYFSVMEQKKNNYLLYWLILGGVSLFILLRIIPEFRFMLPELLVLIFAGIIIRGLIIQQKKSKQNDTPSGKIESNLAYCREQIAKIQQERKEIKDNINDLKQKLKDVDELPVAQRQESEQLLKAFENELTLRQTKIAFYDACIKKLEKLIGQMRIADLLAEKKEKLKQLKEDNYDQLADMEAFRSDVEFNLSELETISELSQRMNQSDSLRDAEQLRLELEKMTRTLEK